MIPSYTIAPVLLVSVVSFLSVEEALISLLCLYGCMVDGWRHEYRNNPREYEEYELGVQEEQSLERIASCLKQGYADEELLRRHINYLENLSKKLSEILSSEQAIGYTNVTLKHDFSKVQHLLSRLGEELDRLDPQDF